MVVQVQADLLAEAGLVSRRQEAYIAQQDEPERRRAGRVDVGSSGKLLVGSVVATQAAWLGALAWLVFRVAF
jgi:hypothetical protein